MFITFILAHDKKSYCLIFQKNTFSQVCIASDYEFYVFKKGEIF